MTILGFYVGGVAAAAFGAVEASKFAHVLVADQSPGSLAAHTVGEINYRGDSNFGKLENKFLSYGWMSCNTQPGGVRLGTDGGGRVLPLRLEAMYIEIDVDSGTTLSGFNRVKTKFTVHDLDGSGNKGALLYQFDGIMKIWSGRMSSDAKIAGKLKPITGDARLKVAKQIYTCAASTL